jgi:predicted dehydrogenase
VVGLGYFGSHHARHYAANARAELVAVVDVDPDRGCAASERYGCASHADHRALIGKVDAVSITVPTSNHHAVASDFLDAGIHVFVEKPITADAASAADLVDRAEKANALLQVGHIERFSPAFRALRERCADPRLISAVRRTEWRGRAIDVDVVLDLMIHDIDLVLALAGATVVAVEAVGAPVVSATNDLAEARLTFANGMMATLAASRVAPKGERTMAIAEPGRYLVADFAAPSLSVIARGEGASMEVRREQIPLIPSDNLAAEIGGFLDCVANGTAPLVDGRAGLAALTIAERILAAIRVEGNKMERSVQ